MNNFDVLVIGGGHAGIEAASACARIGMSTGFITMDKQKIGLMSCNPAIGGLAKGQLVKEIDALGGEMAKITDLAGIHFKMLNKSKGPAVWSPRAQADRLYYAKVAQDRLYGLKKLSIIEASANGLYIKNKRVVGVFIGKDHPILAKTVIITSGTFLNGVIHIGLRSFKAGRAGEKSAVGITESLLNEGLEVGRLKTGTPPRLAKDSIDFTNFNIQEPDDPPIPFSFSTRHLLQRQIPCHIAHTNESTHAALRDGFDQSPMFLGRIKAVGPRYCPSIEDKVNRFSQKKRHQLFLEPEGYNNPEIYLNGFSTSLPETVQRKAIKTIEGLEKANIVRLGYAVEYDYFPPHQLKYSLESKIIDNLFFAGQINGTSGYEEAAAQGLIAGINATQKILGQPPFKLKRSEAYIGVLIDDLINKSTLEPYRMFTSRAEFRLLLRQDNADLRLAHFGHELGLVTNSEYKRVLNKKKEIERLRDYLSTKNITQKQFNTYFGQRSSTISQPVKASVLLRRPEINLRDLLSLLNIEAFNEEALQEVEYNIKYEGYIKRNQYLINRFIDQESKIIPTSFNFSSIKSLSSEAKEKLEKIRPESFGQASRISGVSPADLSVLLIYLERTKRQGHVPRET